MNPPTYRPEWIDTMPTHRVPHCPPCSGDCHQGRSCPMIEPESVGEPADPPFFLWAILFGWIVVILIAVSQ